MLAALGMEDETVGLPVYPKRNLAADFIHKLDNRRFGAFKTKLQNDARGGIRELPRTRADAYTLEHRPKCNTSDVQDYGHPAVFVADAKPASRKRRRDEDQKGEEPEPQKSERRTSLRLVPAIGDCPKGARGGKDKLEGLRAGGRR